MGWIIFIMAVLGWHIGMYGMFKKAGMEPWTAFIPFYNTWCMVEKMGLRGLVLSAINTSRWSVHNHLAHYKVCRTFWKVWNITTCRNSFSSIHLFSLPRF